MKNVILQGHEDMTLKSKAFDLAKERLNVENLDGCLDLLVIEPNDKNIIGIDEARQIDDFVSFEPVTAKNRVVIILSMQFATKGFQNAILKHLEDDQAEYIVTVGDGKLLDTVYSRCERRNLAPENRKPAFENILSSLDGTRSDFFKALSLLDENKKCFYQLNSENPAVVCDFLEALKDRIVGLYEKDKIDVSAAISVSKEIDFAERKIKEKHFSKNCFFSLMKYVSANIFQ